MEVWLAACTQTSLAHMLIWKFGALQTLTTLGGEPGMVVNAYNPSTQETEARVSQVLG
jgi:hypothetical protein